MATGTAALPVTRYITLQLYNHHALPRRPLWIAENPPPLKYRRHDISPVTALGPRFPFWLKLLKGKTNKFIIISRQIGEILECQLRISLTEPGWRAFT